MPPVMNTHPEETLMDPRLTTTGLGFEGYRIVESLGVVRGISVRSRSVIGSTIAKLQTIVGGNITFLTELCERTREEAFDILLAHAERVGANAVVAVRYDSSELMPGVSEVLCYGTAVVLEQVDA
jgi:uncharacterized protein YbjQ (UPF0145 family)